MNSAAKIDQRAPGNTWSCGYHILELRQFASFLVVFIK